MKLEMRNALLRGHSSSGKQLLARSLETDETRRVDAVTQVETDRTDRSAIAQSKSYRVDHIVELVPRYLVIHRDRLLFPPKADAARPGVGVPGVMKQDPTDVLTHQREAQLDAV